MTTDNLILRALCKAFVLAEAYSDEADCKLMHEAEQLHRKQMAAACCFPDCTCAPDAAGDVHCPHVSLAAASHPSTGEKQEDRHALKPCAFCGKSVAVLTTARELADEPDDHMHSDSWAVHCDAHMPGGPGGCGASGGFYPTEAEAIAAWNRRTPQEAAQPEEPASTRLRNFLTMVRRWVEREGGDMDAAIAWMYADHAPSPSSLSQEDRELMERAAEALEYMHKEKCDYMTRNKLGNPVHETAYRLAVPAIAALRTRLQAPAPTLRALGGAPGQATEGGKE